MVAFCNRFRSSRKTFRKFTRIGAGDPPSVRHAVCGAIIVQNRSPRIHGESDGPDRLQGVLERVQPEAGPRRSAAPSLLRDILPLIPNAFGNFRLV